jgi:hypothetical protein
MRIVARSVAFSRSQPMNTTLRRKGLLSTRRSVAIFGIALCLAVAGATETVFAYRDHELDTKARTGREFEVGAATVDRVPIVSEAYDFRQSLRVSAFEAAQANHDRARNPDYVFASNITSAAQAGATRTGPDIKLEPPMDTSNFPVFAQPVSRNASPVLAAQAASEASAEPSAQPSSGRDAQPPPPAIVQCGNATCPEGQVCCNASCGTCAMPGDMCSQLVCGMSTSLMSVSCGSNTCNVGQSCCNASCGICVGPGEPCDATKECENQIQYPFSATCGMATCNAGLVCCNPSCGICARFGEACSQSACD